MYHIAICDDNQRYIEYMEKMLIHRSGLQNEQVCFYRYHSGEALSRDLHRKIPFHLLILDMQLGEMDGDTTAEAFRKHYPDTLLVFCSGVVLPTVKSFEANAYRYLLKSHDSDRMERELKNIVREMRKLADSPRIPLVYRNDTVLVDIKDILYVCLRKHGCSVYMRDQKTGETMLYLSSQKLDQLYEKLKVYGFIYAHNSYFVNPAYILKYVNHEIHLTDRTILTVSKSREKMFREAFAVYLASKY